MPTSANIGAELVAWARTQIGVPWEHQGRAPGKGLDCVGLPVCGGRALGLRVVDLLAYSQDVESSMLLEVLAQNCQRVEDAQPGDLLALWVRHETRPKHVVIDSGGGNMIHAHRELGGGKVCEEEIGPFWSKRIHSRWRYDAWR